MAKFQIFADSCCDLSTAARKSLNVEYFRMGLNVEGKDTFADLDWKLYSPEQFYDWVGSGKHMKTSQVSMEEFTTRMRPFLEQGIDILYIACSSALSGSVGFFEICKQSLQEEFPDRKMIALDPLTSSGCQGMMCMKASQLQKEGKTIEEVYDELDKTKFFYNQWCTVDTLTYLKNAGRIKGSKAFFGNLMGVKPVFISDRKGNNFVIGKARGTKASIQAVFDGIKNTIDKEQWNYVSIVHALNPEVAKLLEKRFKEELGVEHVESFIMGPIVGLTCGPGTFAAFCYGKEVTRFDGDGK